MTERYECCKKACKWTGAIAEKVRRTDKPCGGLTITTLTCPKCGGEDFYDKPVPPSNPKIEAVNEWLKFIGSCGREFFNHKGVLATMEQDGRGRVWFVDEYSRRRVYTHYKWRWVGFNNGGTLRRLVESLRDFIRLDAQIRPAYFNHSTLYCSGHPWGYSEEDMLAIRDEGIRLGIVSEVTKDAP